MKILATAKAFAVPSDVATSLRTKGNFSLIALPNELLEKHGIKSFEVIEDENKIMLVAAATNEINRTTNEVLS